MFPPSAPPRPRLGRCLDAASSHSGYGDKVDKDVAIKQSSRGFEPLSLLLCLLLTSFLSLAAGVHEGYEKVLCHPDYNNATTIFDFDFKNLSGTISPLSLRRGQVLLIVNTATY